MTASRPHHTGPTPRPSPRYPALDRNLDVDVVVVGAGITGLTAAYLLKKAGRRVAVLERRRVGGVDTMMTTAHVTCVTDLDLSELVKNFGRDHAQAAWDAGLAAIAQIDTIVSDEEIDCGWTWVEGVKHLRAGQDTAKVVERLQEEARLASELGFEARYVEKAPFVNRPGASSAGRRGSIRGNTWRRSPRLSTAAGRSSSKRAAWKR